MQGLSHLCMSQTIGQLIHGFPPRGAPFAITKSGKFELGSALGQSRRSGDVCVKPAYTPKAAAIADMSDLVVVKLDRSTRDVLSLVHELESKGAHLASSSQKSRSRARLA